MNDMKERAPPRLWTPDGFLADKWIRSDSPDRDRPAILSLEAYLKPDGNSHAGFMNETGVELQPGDELDKIVPYLDQLTMVVLVFPAFGDGRGFSKAQLLRNRHHYPGAIRATGEVLTDQIPLMLRTGINEFEVTDETALARLREGQIGGIAFHYQPAAKTTKSEGGYSWRRLPA